MFSEGSTLGKYQLSKRLAMTQMSEVWVATDTTGQRMLALKLVRKSEDNEALVNAAQFGADLQRRISDPRVVSVHDYGTIGEYFFIDMEYVPGSDIEKLLTAKIAKGEAEAAPAVPKQVPVKASPPQNLQQLVDYILVNSEDVGKEFPAEARRIHNEEAPHRNIRGLATVEETRELLDEGIAVLPLPVPPSSEWN